ncbi:MAG: alpha/beta fold hydrolase [Rhodobacteraceae bacterium]|nr:alpha/beta fold hydrolase [Paracoccaceae bacterium]
MAYPALIGLLTAALVSGGAAHGAAQSPEALDTVAPCTVLVHGLGRSSASFWVAERAFERLGHQVVSVDYPSTEITLTEAAEYLDTAMATCEATQVNVVTHSMGGIVLRVWAKTHDPARVARAVMLSPPNAGSVIVETFDGYDLFRDHVGPAGTELAADVRDTIAGLGPVPFDLGVIAGDVSLNPVFSGIIPGPDDGTVAVASTRVEGMADHIVLHTSHTFVMNNPAVLAQTMTFLHTGKFDADLSYEDMRALWRGESG